MRGPNSSISSSLASYRSGPSTTVYAAFGEPVDKVVEVGRACGH